VTNYQNVSVTKASRQKLMAMFQSKKKQIQSKLFKRNQALFWSWY